MFWISLKATQVILPACSFDYMCRLTARLSQSAFGAQGDVSAMQQQVVYQDEMLRDTIASRALVTLHQYFWKGAPKALSALPNKFARAAGENHKHNRDPNDRAKLYPRTGDPLLRFSWRNPVICSSLLVDRLDFMHIKTTLPLDPLTCCWPSSNPLDDSLPLHPFAVYNVSICFSSRHVTQCVGFCFGKCLGWSHFDVHGAWCCLDEGVGTVEMIYLILRGWCCRFLWMDWNAILQLHAFYIGVACIIPSYEQSSPEKQAGDIFAYIFSSYLGRLK